MSPKNVIARGLSPVERAICVGTADQAQGVRELDAKLPPDEDAALWEEARLNGVESIVAHSLMRSGVREGAAEAWRKAHDDTYARISAYVTELDRVASLLDSHGIRLVALKNAGIAKGLGVCLGCCPMGDLDVLVDQADFRAAHRLLERDGYRFEFRSPLEIADLPSADASGGAEYWKPFPEGGKLWLELQWRPISGRWIRPDQEPSGRDLIERSMTIPGSAVRILSAEDNLLQVCLHTAKHSYVRAPGFRLHTDVDRVVRRQAVNWDKFLAQVSALRVKTAVYFSLALAHDLLGSPIEPRVLSALAPPGWKVKLMSSWLRRVGLFHPDDKKFSRVGYVLFTALLYDDPRGLWRAIFPSPTWMREQFRVRKSFLLPYYYGRRIADLLLRRVSS